MATFVQKAMENLYTLINALFSLRKGTWHTLHSGVIRGVTGCLLLEALEGGTHKLKVACELSVRCLTMGSVTCANLQRRWRKVIKTV